MIFKRRPGQQRRPLATGVSLWADRAGFTHFDDGVQHLVADAADEVCFIVSEQSDGTAAVFRRERDQEPVWVMAAKDIDDVGRFLCVELGPAARSLDGMEPVLVSFGDEIRTGWRVDQDEDRLRVLDPGGTEIAAFALEDPFGVSRSAAFTQYAQVSWEDLFSVLTLQVERDPSDA